MRVITHIIISLCISVFVNYLGSFFIFIPVSRELFINVFFISFLIITLLHRISRAISLNQIGQKNNELSKMGIILIVTIIVFIIVILFI